MRHDVHARGIEPEEERFVVGLGLIHKLEGQIADLVVDCLHPLGIERARILDLLFADLAPARHVRRIVCGRGPRVDHVARPDLIQEFLRIGGMRGIFHGIEVIEVAEELIEAVDGRQKLIEVAEVVLAELAGGVPHRLQDGGDGAGLGGEPGLGSSLADGGHSGTNR